MSGSHARGERNLRLPAAASALVVTGLFGFGLQLGDRHRDAVLSFERAYFGWLDLEPGPRLELPSVPAAHESVPAQPWQAHAPSPASQVLDPPSAAPAPAELPAVTEGRLDVAPSPTAPAAEALSAAAAPATAQAQALAPDSIPPPQRAEPSLAAPPPPPLASSTSAFAVPVTLRVKVLVDDRLVDANDDWLLMAVRTVSAASKVYRGLFGIELSLAGAVRWSGARAALGGAVLHQELRAHPREDADLLLGFVDSPLHAADYELGAPDDANVLSGAYGLVGPTKGAELPFLPGTLRSLGHLLGAKSVQDGTEEYRLGSFMSDAPPPIGRPPWVDLANRERILARKGRPFQSEPAR